MDLQIFDLHADLLCYLANDPSRTPHDTAVRCSLNQLRKGKVFFQLLPLFSDTVPGSAKQGLLQWEIFKALPFKTSFEFVHDLTMGNLNSKAICIKLAIENGSAIAEEEEPLKTIFERLSMMQERTPISYLSLTWNGENRFGGGAHTDIGLKLDGKELLKFLSHHDIVIDLSHASDRLAYDILDYIDGQKLSSRVIASHSNLRSVTNVPRNLPDMLVLEIIKRRGLIGLNQVRSFVGFESPKYFAHHLRHLIELNGENSACLGADFFCLEDVPLAYRKPEEQTFFPEFNNASSYPNLIALLKKELSLSDEFLAKLTHKNAAAFFE